MSRTLNARGVEPGGGSRGIHAPECRLAIKAASATGFLVEPWLTRRTLNANRHPAIQSKLLLRFRKNAVQEEFCNRARLHRLQKNSIREALCVRARLQSCRKQHKISAGFSVCVRTSFNDHILGSTNSEGPIYCGQTCRNWGSHADTLAPAGTLFQNFTPFSRRTGLGRASGITQQQSKQPWRSSPSGRVGGGNTAAASQIPEAEHAAMKRLDRKTDG